MFPRIHQITPGMFLGGYEIDGATKMEWDKDWNKLSESVDAASLQLAALTTSEISALPSAFSTATHVQFNYFNEELKEPKPGSKFKYDYLGKAMVRLSISPKQMSHRIRCLLVESRSGQTKTLIKVRGSMVELWIFPLGLK